MGEALKYAAVHRQLSGSTTHLLSHSLCLPHKPDLVKSQLILLTRRVSSLHMFCRMKSTGDRRRDGVVVKE